MFTFLSGDTRQLLTKSKQNVSKIAKIRSSIGFSNLATLLLFCLHFFQISKSKKNEKEVVFCENLTICDSFRNGRQQSVEAEEFFSHSYFPWKQLSWIEDAHYGNYRNLLPPFLCKNYVKSTDLILNYTLWVIFTNF